MLNGLPPLENMPENTIKYLDICNYKKSKITQNAMEIKIQNVLNKGNNNEVNDVACLKLGIFNWQIVVDASMVAFKLKVRNSENHGPLDWPQY